jgi:A/G-specific adenine glycosylase
MNNFSLHSLDEFKKLVWDFYQHNKRQFDWRDVEDPYQIVVSEVMLQQTQTSRVQKKFHEFLQKFPNFNALAQAERVDVLKIWVGLGYNRRAVALHEIAKRVMLEYKGQLPADVETLKTFKGLGHATASSIVAFAFNKPTVFIETNIRTVFLHCFYRNEELIHDKMLMPLVAMTVDQVNPRQWYYALTDYGVYLKKEHKNPSRNSKHHQVQSTFAGSDRQIRGAIIKFLTEHTKATQNKLIKNLAFEKERILAQTEKLIAEQMVIKNKNSLSL